MSEKNPFSRSFWRSPRPPHAFVLGRDRLVYVGPQEAAKKAALGAAPALRVVSRALPEEAFTAGPGDIPIAGAAVAGALQRLLAEVGMYVARVDEVDYHGTSLRIFARRGAEDLTPEPVTAPRGA